MLRLPIDALVDGILDSLERHPGLVVVAAPGAGKSTRIPPALMGRRPGRVLVLEPRRIAAKALAARIAQEQGSRLGEAVGYRIRFESRESERTRLLLMTEGMLSRQFLSDPYLDGVGTVVLDEFHERSLHADLALAYLRDLQRSVREDLRIVVMSASIDAAPIQRFLGDCGLVHSHGRLFPIQTRFSRARADLPLAERILAALEEADAEEAAGDVLVFLPGVGEIMACRERLGAAWHGAEVRILHGQVDAAEQEAVLAPSPRRRIILATNIAETSLTIPGVRTVIDSGLVRVARCDAQTGVPSLDLEWISRSSALQRAGRAGREGPGRCLRLWTPTADARLAATSESEVARADLAASVALVKLLGYHDSRRFPWYEAPDDVRLQRTEELLTGLAFCPAPFAALGADGRRWAALPVHPRAARLMEAAAALGEAGLRLGATLAALSGDSDILAGPAGRPPARGQTQENDVIARLEVCAAWERGDRGARAAAGTTVDGAALSRVLRVRDQLLQAWRAPSGRHVARPPRPLAGPGPAAAGAPAAGDAFPDATTLSRLLLIAFPDRVARRQPGDGNRAMMVGGWAVELDPRSVLWQAPVARSGAGHQAAPPAVGSGGGLIICVDLQTVARQGRATVLVRQAVAVTEETLAATLPEALRREVAVAYDAARERVQARALWHYRDLIIREASAAIEDRAAASRCLQEALATEGGAVLLGLPAAEQWLRRYAWLQPYAAELGLPTIDGAAIIQAVQACAQGCIALDEVRARDPLAWLLASWDRAQRQAVEAWAPAALTLPSGRSAALVYPEVPAAWWRPGGEPAPAADPAGASGPTAHATPAAPATPPAPPILAARIQDLFSWSATPRIAGGRVAVLLHLLAPNGRVQQITDDLASFWAGAYAQVRKDLRARYPRHAWPDDPAHAAPSSRPAPRR